MSTAIDLITMPTTASFPHNIHSIMIPDKLSPTTSPKSPKSPTSRVATAQESSASSAKTSQPLPHTTKPAPPPFELTDESEESNSRGSQETQEERKLDDSNDDEENGENNFLTPKNTTPEKTSEQKADLDSADSDTEHETRSPSLKAQNEGSIHSDKPEDEGSLEELAKPSLLLADSASNDGSITAVSSETNDANEESKEEIEEKPQPPSKDKKVNEGAKEEVITQIVKSLIPVDYEPPPPSTAKGIEITRTKAKKATASASTPKIATSAPTRPKAATILSNTFRRRSWMPSSRSPSPQKESQNEDGIPPPPVPDLRSAVKQLSSSPSRSRLSTALLGKGNKSSSNSRPVSAYAQSSGFRRRLSSALSLTSVAKDALKEAGDSAPTLPKSRSAELLKIPRRVGNLTPSSRSSDRLSTMGQLDGLSFSTSSKGRSLKKRDDLHKAFNDLDNACTKFNGKTAEQKIAVIHSQLLPFLEDTEKHQSNFKLQPDELNRRIRILHRWWMGLLEYVKTPEFNGCSSASKSEILDSILALMNRPEWYVYPSPFAQSFYKKRMASGDGVSESTASMDSEMAVESVQQNIRNLMSDALLMQVAFVVEKMSSRAFASVTAFCAKTCAYAFFFCPGMSGLMVKLWNVKLESIKRVLEASGLSTEEDMTEMADRLTQHLPSPVKDVAYTNMKEVSNKLKRALYIPDEVKEVQWWGSWLDRWTGQDTDLFYGFVRNYYSLLYFYLPESTEAERLTVAGGVFVQSQILANLNAAIGRYTPKPPTEVVPPAVAAANNVLRLSAIDENGKAPIGGINNSYNITLDDVLADPDSSAVPLLPSSTPMNNPIHRGNPVNNADRAAAENRFILLIKDVLATKDVKKGKSGADSKGKAAVQNQETSITTPNCISPTTSGNMRNAFAQLLATMLQAAALGTSQYNRFAAEILCNLTEEAVVTLARYEYQQLQKQKSAKDNQESPVGKRMSHAEGSVSFLDWPFWFGVWKLMTMSNNYFTEIRVYSLIHSIWPAIVLDESRKRLLCETFLLDRAHFESRFSHWSPMVRAYFMRLICWRVARINDEDEDMTAVELLEERLRDIYAYYQHINKLAAASNSMGPSTVPSNAAPNRKFVILRTEPGPKHDGEKVDYNGLMPQSPAYKRSLVLEQLSSIDLPGPSSMPPFDGRLNGLSAGSSIDSDRAATGEDSSAGNGLKPRWASSSRLSSFIRNSTPAPNRFDQFRSKSVSPSRDGPESRSRPPTSTPDLNRLSRRDSKPSLGRPVSGMATLTLSRPGTSSASKSGNNSPSDEFTDEGGFGVFRSHCFRFSLELVDRRGNPPMSVALQHPRLPTHTQLLIADRLRRTSIVRARAHQRTMSTSSGASIGFGAGLLGELYAEFSSSGGARPSSLALAALTAEGYLANTPDGPSLVAPETTAAYCGRALAEWTLVVGECNMFFERRRHEHVPIRWVETPLLGTEGLVRGPRGG